MLETKKLTKIYKPKKGVPVVALNGVDIKFPEKGLVFLLGKSGSGKSTLLHLLGGLDKYDSGEIIIKGVSSKTFRQKHFDSYRNTYVGFIFQDYNILEEFTVGANIALAIELQGRRANDSEINNILHEVDLDGYGARKPNELSGGQKQRVAIARALVKNPQIIMADEPTGALDSNTGRQVLDTLKKLSSDKLVIVVSHDREFAQQYADRIIELSDGQIINDVEVSNDTKKTVADKLCFEGDTVIVPEEYVLTEQDRVAINDYIATLKKGIKIKLPDFDRLRRNFVPTNTEKIKYTDTSFKLIKSKLPIKSAVKIGASGLKYKKIRLVITILLSCVAFGLFGLSDTIAAYNHIETCSNSIVDTGIDYVSLAKSKKKVYGDYVTYEEWGYTLTEENINAVSNDLGIRFKGVYMPLGGDLGFSDSYDQDYEFTKTEFHIYAYDFNGFSELTAEDLSVMGYKIVDGILPSGDKNEIGISSYVAKTFMLGGYTDGTTYVNKKGETKFKFQTITKEGDLIGKTLNLNGEKYTITCVIDTGFDISRYQSLTEEPEAGYQAADQLVDYALLSELNSIREYSNIQIAFVGEGFVDRMLENEPNVKEITNGYICYSHETDNEYYELYPNYLGTLNDIDINLVKWIGGNKTELSENEIIVSADLLVNAGEGYYETDAKGNEKFVLDGEIRKFTKHGHLDSGDWDDFYNAGTEYTVVGYIDNLKYRDIIIGTDKECEGFIEPDNGPYLYCVGNMPQNYEEVKEIVSYCYQEDVDMRFALRNSVTYELDMIHEAFTEVARIFLYIGIGFALFSALMLANFISTSISYKKQEIGILRAIGSRSNDVFSIFFSESFIIAFINFVLSAIGVFIVTQIINIYVRREIGLLVTILNFGIRQIVLLLVISIAIAALASFVPVKKIASKRPIDAIKNR